MTNKQFWIWTSVYGVLVLALAVGQHLVIVGDGKVTDDQADAFFPTAAQVLAGLVVALSVDLVLGARARGPAANAGATVAIIAIAVGLCASIAGTVLEENEARDAMAVLAGVALAVSIFAVACLTVVALIWPHDQPTRETAGGG